VSVGIPSGDLLGNGSLNIAGFDTTAGNLYVSLNNSAGVYSGAGTPEGAVVARVGSLFLRINGGAGTTFYVKESGTGNTGWVAK
jgi:hypothetical protein